MNRFLASIALLSLVALPAGAATTSNRNSSNKAPAKKAAPKKETKKVDDYKDLVVDMKTAKGTVTIRFFPEVAPNHVKNFIDLSRSGFYNGTKFHRIVPGFMIQGGDPNTKSADARSWGTGGSGKNLKAEFNSVHHRRGILSMARSQNPDSASSQFFVVVAEAGFLDKQYTVFGEVVSGMEAVDKIVSGPARGEMAAEPVTIESMTVRPAKESEKGPLPK
jgi:peptidyl-prolyl cis-trans isomerase B (cyclophilin B)